MSNGAQSHGEGYGKKEDSIEDLKKAEVYLRWAIAEAENS